MTEDTLRLSKVVAGQVPCSRGDAELYIGEGRVRVDGRVVTQPQHRVGSGQRVEVDALGPLQAALPATLLLNKPAGMGAEAALASLAAATRWEQDPSRLRFIPRHNAGLVALMPLPDPASGLCVFSQDRGIVRRLRDEANLIEQELVVDVDGTIAPGGLHRLAGGLLFEGGPLPAARVSWQSEKRLRFAVKGIRPDVVPWMCRQVGLEAVALKRIRLGRVPMAALPPGQWRYLETGERL